MRHRWLTFYTGITAAITVLAIVSAVQAYNRADAGGRSQREAAAATAAVAHAEHADAAAVARNAAATLATDRLTKQVNTNVKKIAAAIERTRKVKRKIIIGSTIVSYVTAPTKAG